LETESSATFDGPLYFYKNDSVVRGTYNQRYGINPELPVPMFEFDVAQSEGVQAVNTIVAVEGRHFYLGRNDVYSFDGNTRVSLTQDPETGSTRIQRYLFDQINLSRFDRTFGVYDETSRKYYIFVVLNTALSIYPEDAFVYDIDLNSWTRETYNPVSAGTSSDVAQNNTIDGLAGAIGNSDDGGPLPGLPGTIDSLTNNPQKLLLFSIGAFTYYTTDTPTDEIGVNDREIESYFITRDFLGKTLEEQDRVQKVYVESRNGTIDMSYSGTYDLDTAEFLQENTLTFGSKYRVEDYNPDAVVTTIRFLVRLTGTEFRWLQVFSKEQEFGNE
jgi:hypothetical protein